MAEWKPTGVHGYRPRKGQFRGWIEALKRYRLFLYGGRERKKKKEKIPMFRYPFCRNCARVGGKSRVGFMRNFTLEFGVSLRPFLSMRVACSIFTEGKQKKKKNEKSVVFAIRWTENIYNFRNFRRAGNISSDTSVFFSFLF